MTALVAINLFFILACTFMAAANIVCAVYYTAKGYVLTALVNIPAALICVLAALFNYNMLLRVWH